MAIAVPVAMPTTQPVMSAHLCSQRVYRPTTIVGIVWLIQTPPSSWKSIAYLTGARMMNSSAPTLTTSDASRATVASWACVTFGRTYSFQMLRVKRWAAAIDITAAGTSAPTAIAANATPTNHDGKTLRNRSGTAKFGLVTEMPRAMAM